MNVSNTPEQRPMALEEVQHTRPPDPTSPSNLQSHKRHKNVVALPPAIRLIGRDSEGSRPDLGIGARGNASTAMRAHLEAVEKSRRVSHNVLQDLASRLDEFATSYGPLGKQDHEVEARRLVDSVLHFLVHDHAARIGQYDSGYKSPHSLRSNTSGASQRTGSTNSGHSVTWAQKVATPVSRTPIRGHSSTSSLNSGAPISRASSQPRISTSRAAPGKFDDKRLLLRASPERRMAADGRESYMIRQRLVATLRPEGLELKDIPDRTVTKTGWALRCATPEVRDQIFNAKSKVLEALKLEDIETPSTWYNYVMR
ncbi:hypothetical protein NPX13_g6201 [Xylaria arbuscula]|uniref:Uncharacterized protein n=1 Tax=Xylaria arbuscula TaxID=114810 RepID=A0A9W8NCW1_9PEZI|nr:hypothetical protein NPX13_g6201 [Xylaria arbuscula]